MTPKNVMDWEFEYYYLDNDQRIRYYTIEDARKAAIELSRELKYYPSIHFVARVIC